MHIERDKYYVTRNGIIVGPMSDCRDTSTKYPWRSYAVYALHDGVMTWTASGKFIQTVARHPLDLLAEIEDPHGDGIEKIMAGAKTDATKFEIAFYEISTTGNTILEVIYEGCKTYGGCKLMVLRGNDHLRRKTLDPHFLEGHPVVARFAPTEEGWRLARICAAAIEQSNQ